MARRLVVFVHGWSVTSTDTYGGLPARLKAEAAAGNGPPLDVRHVYLGEYVSFRDEVRLEDISRAFDAAIADVLAAAGGNRRFACVTHSTGGPVVRDWLHRFYVARKRDDQCPMSHLLMLAPANFGSALAQLGKSRLSRLRTWFQGVEPGQRVLDWLELGSSEACELNLRWIRDYGRLRLTHGPRPVFQFVITGDAIDRKLYDHVNAYTGETGSDGVVRVAAANLNATHLVLEQPAIQRGETLPSARKRLRTLTLKGSARAPRCAFKIVPGASHSGTDMGIMRSVRNDGQPHATVSAMLRCLAVDSHNAYETLCDAFAAENSVHQAVTNRLEVQRVRVLPDREFIHDPHAMVILRLLDDQGAMAPDNDILVTAGPAHSPDELPHGFLADRQGNRRAPGTVTFFLNHAMLAGCDPIPRADGRTARPALIPRPPYGLRVLPRNEDRLVEYWATETAHAMGDILRYIRPNETTILDIRLTRIVREGVFRFTQSLAPRSFKRPPPGAAV